MQTRNPLLNDFAELMSDAFAAAQAAGGEAKTAFKAQMHRVLAEMDLVEREEFEAARDMAAAARAENEALTKRIEALEAAMKKAPAKAASKTSKPVTAARPRTGTRTPPARKAAKPKKD